MFWQGGFTFYSGVAIPIGRHVLAEEVDLQSVITQRVTSWLNVAGVVALFLLAWDMAASVASTSQRRARLALWLVLAVSQAALFYLHYDLSILFDTEEFRILDRGAFRLDHRLYLWTSTLEWACGAVPGGLPGRLANGRRGCGPE